MSDSINVFEMFHATLAKLDNWTPGDPAPKMKKPTLFIGKVLDLVVHARLLLSILVLSC